MAQDDAVWHALIGDEEQGPLSHAQMLAHLRDGTLDGSDLVWRPGLNDWLPLRDVREFWQPPRAPARQPQVEPPPLPLPGSTAQPEEKWSLWGAASAGLMPSAAVLWISALTTESYKLASYAHSPSIDSVAYLFG